MAIVTLHAGKRYAMRRRVRLQSGNKKRALAGLLIELSQEGCRISGLNDTAFAMGEAVSVNFSDHRLDGCVRWSTSNLAGIRFGKPLSVSDLGALLDASAGPRELRRYGT